MKGYKGAMKRKQDFILNDDEVDEETRIEMINAVRYIVGNKIVNENIVIKRYFNKLKRLT